MCARIANSAHGVSISSLPPRNLAALERNVQAHHVPTSDLLCRCSACCWQSRVCCSGIRSAAWSRRPPGWSTEQLPRWSTEWLSKRPAQWLPGWPVQCLPGRPTAWLPGWPAKWLPGRPTEWLPGWPAICEATVSKVNCETQQGRKQLGCYILIVNNVDANTTGCR